MTPNTIPYMIAGFAVIFSAIVGYALSLAMRMRRLAKEKKSYLDNKMQE
jgi:CcmD family protein